jgi:hypothetical protein
MGAAVLSDYSIASKYNVLNDDVEEDCPDKEKSIGDYGKEAMTNALVTCALSPLDYFNATDIVQDDIENCNFKVFDIGGALIQETCASTMAAIPDYPEDYLDFATDFCVDIICALKDKAEKEIDKDGVEGVTSVTCEEAEDEADEVEAEKEKKRKEKEQEREDNGEETLSEEEQAEQADLEDSLAEEASEEAAEEAATETADAAADAAAEATEVATEEVLEDVVIDTTVDVGTDILVDCLVGLCFL